MNKNTLKKIISKYDIFIIFTFSILILFGFMFFLEIDSNDELWNFQNVNKINNGFEIYRDANVIITPLFFNIGSIFLKIFGSALISFRILNIVICSIFILTVYIFLKILKISKFSSMVYTSLISIVIVILSLCGANYNMLAAYIYILGLMLYIKENKYKTWVNNLLQGIIIFLIFLTKQNLTIYYILGMTVCEIILNKNLKNTFKKLLGRFSVSFALLLTFILSIYLNNNLYDFVNYTILGIPEFTKHLSLDIPSIWNLGIIGIVVTVSIMYVKKTNTCKEEKSNIIKLILMGICLMLIAYPIINIYHSMLGSIAIYILAFYILDNILNTHARDFKKIVLKFIFFFSIVIFILIFSFSIVKLNFTNNTMILNDIPIYSNCFINEELKKDIINVTEYIKYKESIGINVIVFSDRAALYMVPLGKSNGAMDLPFLGNMGHKGEENMLKTIQNLKNSEILIVNEEEKNRVFTQQSEIIWNYITENKPKIGEIERFNIYKFE